MPHHGLAKLGIFHLGKIANISPSVHMRAGANTREWPDLDIFIDLRIFDHRLGDLHPLANNGISQQRIRADDAIPAHHRVAQNVGVWQNGGIGRNRGAGIDIGAGGVDEGDTVHHVHTVNTFAQNGGGIGQINPIVNANHLINIVRHNGLHTAAFSIGDLDQISEKIFAFLGVWLNFLQRLP